MSTKMRVNPTTVFLSKTAKYYWVSIRGIDIKSGSLETAALPCTPLSVEMYQYHGLNSQ